MPFWHNAPRRKSPTVVGLHKLLKDNIAEEVVAKVAEKDNADYMNYPPARL